MSDTNSSFSRYSALSTGTSDYTRSTRSLAADGFEHMHTPHIDSLAQRGTTFTRAYVQVAVCMPSRQAIMTSRRPDTSMGWTISPLQHFRHCGGSCGANTCSGYPPAAGAGVAAGTRQCGIPDLVTLPGWFL